MFYWVPFLLIFAYYRMRGLLKQSCTGHSAAHIWEISIIWIWKHHGLSFHIYSNQIMTQSCSFLICSGLSFINSLLFPKVEQRPYCSFIRKHNANQ